MDPPPWTNSHSRPGAGFGLSDDDHCRIKPAGDRRERSPAARDEPLRRRASRGAQRADAGRPPDSLRGLGRRGPRIAPTSVFDLEKPAPIARLTPSAMRRSLTQARALARAPRARPRARAPRARRAPAVRPPARPIRPGPGRRRRQPARWVVECKHSPSSKLDGHAAPSDGERCFLNFCRAADSLSRYSSWPFAAGDFHRMENFGRDRFQAALRSRHPPGPLRRLGPGKLNAQVELTGLRFHPLVTGAQDGPAGPRCQADPGNPPSRLAVYSTWSRSSRLRSSVVFTTSRSGQHGPGATCTINACRCGWSSPMTSPRKAIPTKVDFGSRPTWPGGRTAQRAGCAISAWCGLARLMQLRGGSLRKRRPGGGNRVVDADLVLPPGRPGELLEVGFGRGQHLAVRRRPPPT